MKVTFPIRNIDKDEWDLFKYNVAKKGYVSTNEALLAMITRYNNKCREE